MWSKQKKKKTKKEGDGSVREIREKRILEKEALVFFFKIYRNQIVGFHRSKR